MKQSASRRVRATMLAAVLILSLGALTLTGCGGSGDAKSLAESKCSTCHSYDKVTSASYTTADEWKACVDRMAAQTSTISDSDAEAITAYLAGN